MKNKTQLVCTISLLLGAVIVIAINFSAGWMGDKPQSVNIAATAFYLLFWVLMLRFKPAAKASSILSLYTMIGSIIGFCATAGEWSGGFVSVILFPLTFPSAALFYGLRFMQDFKIFYLIVAAISFAILIFSLITLVNKPSKTE